MTQDKAFMNKKGQSIDLLMNVVIILIAIFCGIMIFGLAYYGITDNITETCKTYKNLKLESVNGIYDKNSGLFSGGSVREKTLLFSNGLVITLEGYESKDIELRIGREYNIKKCEMMSGNIDYEVLK